MNAPELGALLAGKYRVLSLLGKGGMGTVYRGQNVLTGKDVALKWMNAGINLSSDLGARLLREAQAACRLSHPNVVNVFDLVHEADTLFLVMELLVGETLRSHLARVRCPPITRVIEFLIPAMDGVSAAHERGVIHRDLKPDNIFLVRPTGVASTTVKVLDFGVAKVIDSDNVTLTQSGATLGTPLYMSIEQLRGAKDVDHRTDVYAFGVILYEAVTGRLPFVANTLGELAIQRATTQPTPILQLRPDTPVGLARVIEWAIARDRDARPPDLRTLIQALVPYRHASVEAPQEAATTARSTSIPAARFPPSVADSDATTTERSGMFASSFVDRPANPELPRRVPWIGTSRMALGAVVAIGLIGASGYRQWESHRARDGVRAAPHLVRPRSELDFSPASDLRAEEIQRDVAVKTKAIGLSAVSGRTSQLTDAGAPERASGAQMSTNQATTPQPKKVLHSKAPSSRTAPSHRTRVERARMHAPAAATAGSTDTAGNTVAPHPSSDDALKRELEALGGRL